MAKEYYKITCTQCGKIVKVKGVRDFAQDQTTFVCEKCNDKNNKTRLGK